MTEPENLTLKLIREMRGEIGEMKSGLDLVGQHMATNVHVAEVRTEVSNSEKRVSERINHLNRAVMEYHSSTIGHGILFGELEERLRRVEDHLKLPPMESH